ncbi:MAG: CHAT domain-containing protein [Candidatus Jettenia caeni]|nr:CHAT domain-containing protein [Candidatus Jettenia caeni]WKZ17041.1 MAG: type III-E CRISPR-associated TPR-CHAT protein Csx29 [Candidatus Jettenia caeni]
MKNRVQIEAIIRNLQGAARDSKTNKLSENIIAYDEYRKIHKSASLYQFGIIPAKESSSVLAENETNHVAYENAIFEMAEKNIENFSSEDIHKKRKEMIESALRLLMGLYKDRHEKLQPRTFVLIAKAYLLRSLITRPKGITIPEKKKEALKKGIGFVESAIKKIQSSENILSHSSDIDLLEKAWRIKSQLYLEYYRVNKDECDKNTLKEVLENSLISGCDKFDKNIEDVQIAIRYCELESSREYLEQIISSHLEGIEFEKARAYKLLELENENEDEIRKSMKVVIEEYLSGFSDPLWEDAVEFINKLKSDNKNCWKELSLDMYKVCREQEAETASLHLRWYWSRQRRLYDLAFIAADKEEEKAKIADSLKSRLSLRWSALEETGKKSKNKREKEEISRILEAEAVAMLGGYIKGARKILKKRRRPLPDEQRSIPKDWIVIHFYVNQLENKCYALIYNKDENTWKCEFVKEYQRLFHVFLTWQTNYNRCKERAADSLVQLCKEIGNAMPFLFDECIIPQDKNVLFIPHDFLHRLPLHGAIHEKNNGVFLENHPCCYLPAWSFTAKENNAVVQGSILLKNFPEYSYEELVSNSTLWTSPVKDPASPDDLKTIIASPEMLVILCHGEADAVNPFNARLKLTGNGISHLEILQSTKMILKGSKIILGACETDLVPPLSDIMDEHLSIATAFLTNGTHEILGTMWQSRPEDIEDIIRLLCDKKTSDTKARGDLWNWQKERIRDYWAGEDAMFYRSVAFRIIGLTI